MADRSNLKRLADALGGQNDYSHTRSHKPGAQARKGRVKLKKIITRTQRRADKKKIGEDQ